MGERGCWYVIFIGYEALNCFMIKCIFKKYVTVEEQSHQVIRMDCTSSFLIFLGREQSSRTQQPDAKSFLCGRKTENKAFIKTHVHGIQWYNINGWNINNNKKSNWEQLLLITHHIPHLHIMTGLRLDWRKAAKLVCLFLFFCFFKRDKYSNITAKRVH